MECAYINLVGKTENSKFIPDTDYESIYYGKTYFVKYANPYRIVLNMANVMSIQKRKYDTVKLTRENIANGIFRRIFHLQERTKWVLEKTGEVTVYYIVMCNEEVVFIDDVWKLPLGDDICMQIENGETYEV